MDLVGIAGVITTVVGIAKAIDDLLSKYRTRLAKQAKALKTLEEVQSECTLTRTLVESMQRSLGSNFDPTTVEKGLMDEFGSHVKQLQRLVKGLEATIRTITRREDTSYIKKKIVEKEDHLRAAVGDVERKRSRVTEVMNEIRQVNTDEQRNQTQSGSSQGDNITEITKIEGKSRELMEEVKGEKRPGAIQRLIEEGADPNFVTIDYFSPGYPKVDTPLLSAIQGPPDRCYDAVDVLLSSGADPNLVAGDEPPLWQAFASGGVALAKRLLDADADPNCPCVRGAGRSLLGAVIFSDEFAQHRLDLVKLALEHGANTEHKGPNDNRPLHDAVEKQRGAEVVELLFMALAHPNPLARGGLTPLMIAAKTGDQPVAELLMMKAADETLESEDGRTAAVIAKEAHNEELAEYLSRWK